MADKKKRRKRGRKLTPEALAKMEADQRVLELILEGRTYQEAADRLDISGPGQAYKMAQRALDRRLGEADEELRRVALERCRLEIGRLWPLVHCDTPDEASFKQLCWWLDHEAKLACRRGA